MRHRKPKSSEREKTWKWVASPVSRRNAEYTNEIPRHGKKTQATEIEKWGDIEASRKKNKTQNAEKYFDDVPKKKTKVSRLMKFIDKNKEFVQVGDNFKFQLGKDPSQIQNS